MFKPVTPAIAAAALAAGLGAHAYAGSALLDFEDLAHGQIVDNEYAANGVTISAFNFTGPNLAVVFDSRQRNTNDRDLEGPNGSDSRAWSRGNLPNNTILGNMLIIQEHGQDNGNGFVSTNPDDEGSRPAGSLTFEFDFLIRDFSFDLVDFEGTDEQNGGFFLTVYSGGEEQTIDFSDFTDGASPWYVPGLQVGNNSANTLPTFSAAELGFSGGFDKVVIGLGGSAAIDNIRYTIVPTPTAAIGGFALLGILGFKRRRA